MTWFNSSYQYKKQITQDHTKVSTASQSSFPMEVAFTDANLKVTGSGGHVTNSSGFDIIFTDSTETTKLDHEIEKYVSTTGEILMHVRIPTLSNSANTVIYMYYGNSSISTSQENKTGVWDSNYQAVYHMNDNAANTTVKDSTSNANNGAAIANTSTMTAVGQIGGALSFNGTSDYITDSAFNLNGTSLTAGAWVKSSDFAQDMMIFEQEPVNGKWGLFFFTDGNLYLRGGSLTGIGAAHPSNGAWHHIVAVITGTTGTIYIDGVSAVTGSVDAIPTGAGMLVVGNYNSGSYLFNGSIDEVRISNSARSAGWIVTEYNNQSSPSTFYSVGSEQSQGISLSVTLAGNGVLTPTLSATRSLPSTTLAGSGTITGTFSLRTALATTLAGNGVLTPVLSAALSLPSVSLNGVGTLTASCALSTSLSTTLAGNGVLTPALSASLALPSVTLAGQGSLSAIPSLTTSLSTTLAGIGALSPALSASKDLGSATLAGAGTLSATPSLSVALTTSLDGRGVLSAVLSAAMTLSAEFDGTSTLTANPTLSTNLSTILAGIGTLNTSGMAMSTNISAELDGIGVLNSTLSTTNTASLAVAMGGQGTLSGALSLATALATSFDGIGALAAAPSLSTALTAALNGIGTLTGAASLSTALTASFDGAGVLTATPQLATALSTSVAGQGALTATLSTGNTASLAVTMAGQGSLAASGNFSVSLASVSLDGAGSLAGNVVLGASIAVAMPGRGTLAGAMSLSIALTATLVGTSSLSGTLTLPVALSVVFAAHGVLLGSLSGGTVIPPLPNAAFYVRSGKGTFYVRKGNATFFVRGE